MNKKDPKHKLFFGWWTVIATGILSGLGHGFFSQGVTVFFKPIQADLHLDRATTSVVSGITRVEGGIDSPIVGWLVDKFGPKWLMFIGVVTMGIGLILMNYVNSLWSYILIWAFLIATGLNMSLSITVDKALTDWFIRKRGLAMGIKFTMLSLGSLVALPFLAWLVKAYNWRIACVVCGIIMIAISPLVLFFVKQKRPEAYGLLPDGAAIDSYADKSAAKSPVKDKLDKHIERGTGAPVREYTLKQAMKTWSYWILCRFTNVLGATWRHTLSAHHTLSH